MDCLLSNKHLLFNSKQLLRQWIRLKPTSIKMKRHEKLHEQRLLPANRNNIPTDIHYFCYMKSTILSVKNMVCPRCITSVQSTLQQLKVPYAKVDLGEIWLIKAPTKASLQVLANALSKNGFELIESKEQQIIEKIKLLIREYLTSEKQFLKKLSVFITQQLPYNYSYLSDLFSSVEGITIEKFLIHERIQKVKELLLYTELSIGEIAFQLNFSSSQHLSIQFKKETGLSPTKFKARRKAHETEQKLYTKK